MTVLPGPAAENFLSVMKNIKEQNICLHVRDLYAIVIV